MATGRSPMTRTVSSMTWLPARRLRTAFSYTVSDGQGGTSTASVTVTIEGTGPDNQAPVAVADEGDDFSTDASTSFVTGSVLANDSDPDGDPLSISAVDTSATVGEVVDNGDGTFTYDPNGQFDDLAAGETATDSFSYTVSDGQGGTSTASVDRHHRGQQVRTIRRRLP